MKYLIAYLILILFTFIVAIDMHEQVHVQIYKNYGIKSNIKIDFPDVVTIPEGNLSKCNSDCWKLHLQNEVFTYNLTGIYLILIIIGSLVVVFLELFEEFIVNYIKFNFYDSSIEEIKNEVGGIESEKEVKGSS